MGRLQTVAGMMAVAAGLAIFAGCGKPANLQLAPHDLTLNCPDGMVLIEAASFYSGPYHTPGAPLFAVSPTQAATATEPSAPGADAAAAGRINPNQTTTVQVPAFCIDRFPRARMEADSANGAPVALGSVSFAQARDICQRLGLHLCSPYQWELACRGKQLDRFPYGNRYDPSCGANAAAVAGGHPSQCVSSYGVYDQLGGKPEWVLGTQDLWSAGEVDGVTMGGLFPGENPADVDCLAQRSGPPKPRSASSHRAPSSPSSGLVAAPDGLDDSNGGTNDANASAANANVVARVRCCGDPGSQSQYILDYER